MKKEPKWQNTNLGRERRQFLEERIRAVRYCGDRDDDESSMPARVAEAKKIVDNFLAARRSKRERESTERNRMCDEARRTILFTDDATVAKNAVDALISAARKRNWIS